MDPIVARKCWRTLEPYHGLIYFAPEASAAYDEIGLEPVQHYFASRAAAMGPVAADVVVATFFNFHPPLVHAAIPGAWERAAPDAIVAARLAAADRVLRRVLGDDVSSPAVAEAADLARAAAEATVPGAGRPLYAAHAALPWPDDSHLVLWHAITVLREFRGDGHIAALLADDVGPCEALVMHGASGEVPSAILKATRAWPDDEWSAAEEELRRRGWLSADGGLTEEGARHRQWVEDRTDALALAPWEALGDERCARLRDLVRPLSKAIVDSRALGGR